MHTPFETPFHPFEHLLPSSPVSGYGFGVGVTSGFIMPAFFELFLRHRLRLNIPKKNERGYTYVCKRI